MREGEESGPSVGAASTSRPILDELVLVVPRDRALPNGSWYGLRRDVPHAEVARLEASAEARPRAAVEPDPSLKQLIPYLVLRDGGAWFLMRRTRAGGDARLHDRYSIGVGGHVNPADGGVAGALAREWAEEVIADAIPAVRFVGLLNDDTTEVGAVHLGVVYAADVAGMAVAVREVDKLCARWASDADVAAVRDELETWSAIVFEALAEVGPTGG
jgi:predicted NUDIX family phosphoesterase